MAKKSKSAAPAKSEATVETKSKRGKKKGAEAPVSNDGAADAAIETPASSESRATEAETPVEEAAPVVSADAPAEPEAEAPAADVAPAENNGKKGKRGKKKKAEEPAPAPEAEVTADAAVSPEAPAETAETEVPAETVSAEAAADVPVEAPADAAVETAPAVVIDWDELARTVEALLFAAEEPLQARELGRCSGSDSATIRKLIPRIREKYETERRPWDILETGTGWRLVTRPEFYPAIQRLKTQTLQRKLTQAGLETLALIAYRQPISRAEVENVRGVGAGPVLRQLLERKLIKISGRGTGLGQPLLYGTTDYFLEHFGLKSLQDLPKPGEFKQ